MAKTICKAIKHRKVKKRIPSIEWYKNGKPQYYCYGYIDGYTDDLLPECKECPDHVDKAWSDYLDYRAECKRER